MTKESVIGVLGGMGPEATCQCFEKLIKNTPAGCDQEHLRIVIVNNLKVPDRMQAILGDGGLHRSRPCARASRPLNEPVLIL